MRLVLLLLLFCPLVIVGQDTVSLPFFEDFSLYTGTPDTTLFAEGGGVTVTNQYAYNSPTLNVATLDGLQRNGEPYDFVSTPPINSLFIDSLSSKPIDMSVITATDSSFFSFYWQAGGKLAQHYPREKDTLSLYFLDSLNTWHRVWYQGGYDTTSVNLVTDFSYEVIEIDTTFLHDAFQFKFELYGNAHGNFGIWNLDLLYIDKNRDREIGRFIGYSELKGSFFGDYYSVPVEHLLAYPAYFYDGSFTSSIRNAGVKNELGLTNTSTGSVQETYTGTTVESFTSGVNAVINSGEAESFDFSTDYASFDAQLSNFGAEEKLQFDLTFTVTAPDSLTSNDTIMLSSYNHDFYAYDDGTAEHGAGIETYNGLVAAVFDIPVADTLRSIDIYFPKLNYDFTDEPLQLYVWKSLEGIDGATETEVLYSVYNIVQYKSEDSDDGFNTFYSYKVYNELIDPDGGVELDSGRFYVGYKQFTYNKISVGLDLNANHKDKFLRNIAGSWEPLFDVTDSAEGSLMIHANFGNSGSIITGIEENTLLEADIYPNPFQDNIIIEGYYQTIQVTDLQGRIVYSDSKTPKWYNEVRLTDLTKGMYIVTLIHGDKIVQKKLIKQ